MFERKPLLVKDLPLNTIKAVIEFYNGIDESTTVVDALHEIAKHCSLMIDEITSLEENKEKFESDLSDKYTKLERKLKNELAEEESAMIKSFNLKEEEKDQEIYKLNTEISYLNQNLELIKKENTILEQKMDDQDELIAEISELNAKVASLKAENIEKDAKFNLLKEIYDNPRVQETKVFEPTIVEPRIIEPRMIPTVSSKSK